VATGVVLNKYHANYLPINPLLKWYNRPAILQLCTFE